MKQQSVHWRARKKNVVMVETVGYLTISYHANYFLKFALWIAFLAHLFYLMFFPLVNDVTTLRSRYIFFICLDAIAIIVVSLSIGASWYYQTRAIEICSKDPNCDYNVANKEARKIIDLGSTANTQQ